MDEKVRRLLRAAVGGEPWAIEALWNAVSQEAVEDWLDGGRLRESQRLAIALLIRDPDTRRRRLGEVVEGLALPHLGRWTGIYSEIEDEQATSAQTPSVTRTSAARQGGGAW